MSTLLASVLYLLLLKNNDTNYSTSLRYISVCINHLSFLMLIVFHSDARNQENHTTNDLISGYICCLVLGMDIQNFIRLVICFTTINYISKIKIFVCVYESLLKFFALSY